MENKIDVGMIDLKDNYKLQIAIKRATYELYKAVQSDIDKDDCLHICKRGFEIKDNDKKYHVVLNIEEVE